MAIFSVIPDRLNDFGNNLSGGPQPLPLGVDALLPWISKTVDANCAKSIEARRENSMACLQVWRNGCFVTSMNPVVIISRSNEKVEFEVRESDAGSLQALLGRENIYTFGDVPFHGQLTHFVQVQSTSNFFSLMLDEPVYRCRMKVRALKDEELEELRGKMKGRE